MVWFVWGGQGRGRHGCGAWGGCGGGGEGGLVGPEGEASVRRQGMVRGAMGESAVVATVVGG